MSFSALGVKQPGRWVENSQQSTWLNRWGSIDAIGAWSAYRAMAPERKNPRIRYAHKVLARAMYEFFQSAVSKGHIAISLAEVDHAWRRSIRLAR